MHTQRMTINEKDVEAHPICESVITCPQCGGRRAEEMPVDACLFFYECTQCGALLRPRQGDCCVFCSYGSVPCPPKQQSSFPQGDDR